MNLDYEKDIEIDETALDVEWLEQASLMLKYSRNEAECERELDVTKEKLDLTKAQIDFDIRKNPDKYGIDKITESVVQNTIIQQEQYRDDYEDFLEVKNNYNIARGASRAINARKDALENLVRLHGQQYFAEPSAPRDLSKQRQAKERDKKVNSRISNKINKRRTK